MEEEAIPSASGNPPAQLPLLIPVRGEPLTTPTPPVNPHAPRDQAVPGAGGSHVPRVPRCREPALPPGAHPPPPRQTQHESRNHIMGSDGREHPASRSRQRAALPTAQGLWALLIAARQEQLLQNAPLSLSPPSHFGPMHARYPHLQSLPRKSLWAAHGGSPGRGSQGDGHALPLLPPPLQPWGAPHFPALTSRRCCCRIFFIPESCCYALLAPTLFPLAFSGNREGEGGAGEAITGKEGCCFPGGCAGGAEGSWGDGGSKDGGKVCVELRMAAC